MPARTADANYRRIRAELLRDQPTCHWCRRRPATEADHLIPYAAGGDDTLDNLVPACKPCNAERGAKWKAQRDQRRRTVFGPRPTMPPRPSNSVSPKTEPEPVLVRPHEPRLETIVADAVGTHGPAVAEWASRVLEVELMDWQRHVLDGQLAYDADGRWCSRLSLVTCARQNGKTVALRALVGWALTDYAALEGRPITVLTTAHNLDLAAALFRDLAPILEAKYDAKVYWSYGRMALEVGKSKWLVRAATPSAAHGLSCDLIVVDELWDVSAEALDVAILPTQRARPNPLCSMWSTAGTEQSHALLRWREQGIRAIDEQTSGLYFAEYSPPPELDPMTPAAWQYANPSPYVSMETLAAEAQAPNRAAFLRSSVNLWVQTDRGWLSPGAWAEARTDQPPLPGGIVVAEVALDDGRYCAIRVNRNAAGELTATVEFVVETMTGCWERLTAIATDPKIKIAVTPTLNVHCPTALARRVALVGYKEIASYTAVVRQAILEGRVKHTGEQLLAEHVGRAVAARTQGTIALASNRSAGPIELARCLVWSVGLSLGSRAGELRPVIATAAQHRVA